MKIIRLVSVIAVAGILGILADRYILGEAVWLGSTRVPAAVSPPSNPNVRGLLSREDLDNILARLAAVEELMTANHQRIDAIENNIKEHTSSDTLALSNPDEKASIDLSVGEFTGQSVSGAFSGPVDLELSVLFLTEAVDERWAEQAEESLSSIVNNSARADISLDGISCRTTVCKLSLSASNQGSLVELSERILDPISGWPGGSESVLNEGVGGYFAVDIYLKRHS